jgi:hypothetical protein
VGLDLHRAALGGDQLGDRVQLVERIGPQRGGGGADEVPARGS